MSYQASFGALLTQAAPYLKPIGGTLLEWHVRPVCAAGVAAGHNALRGSGPNHVV